jgi:hypothetical protein
LRGMGDCSSGGGDPKEHIEHNRRVRQEAIALFGDSIWKLLAGPDAHRLVFEVTKQRGKLSNHLRISFQEEHAV